MAGLRLHICWRNLTKAGVCCLRIVAILVELHPILTTNTDYTGGTYTAWLHIISIFFETISMYCFVSKHIYFNFCTLHILMPTLDIQSVPDKLFYALAGCHLSASSWSLNVSPQLRLFIWWEWNKDAEQIVSNKNCFCLSLGTCVRMKHGDQKWSFQRPAQWLQSDRRYIRVFAPL